jgi:hypothetical protein
VSPNVNADDDDVNDDDNDDDDDVASHWPNASFVVAAGLSTPPLPLLALPLSAAPMQTPSPPSASHATHFCAPSAFCTAQCTHSQPDGAAFHARADAAGATGDFSSSSFVAADLWNGDGTAATVRVCEATTALSSSLSAESFSCRRANRALRRSRRMAPSASRSARARCNAASILLSVCMNDAMRSAVRLVLCRVLCGVCCVLKNLNEKCKWCN